MDKTRKRIGFGLVACVLFLSLRHVSGVTRHNRAPKNCVASSLCELCPSDAMPTEACFLTGRRIQMTCRRQGTATVSYRSCDRTVQDDQVQFFYFLAWMLAIGTFAFLVVKRRKLLNQSLYDQRARASGPQHNGAIELIDQSQRSSLSWRRNNCL